MSLSHISRRLLHSSSMSPARVALVFSGCGVYDGTEITEGVSALVHLSRAGCEVSMFAPNKTAMHTIDHTTGNESEGRNVLVESARIARGNIQALDACKAENFDAVVLPGGFGAAKNLCDFAVKNEEMTVDSNVEKVMKEFLESKKVIGLCCVAPVLAAKVIPGVKLTVGDSVEGDKWPFAGTAAACEKMGAAHVVKGYDEAMVDEDKLVVTSPAYMYNGKPHEIDDSVKAMVDGVLTLVAKTQS